ncbi:MAG: WG repeat-containing protein, partial [Clostridia bacterium]|nr:WG repeat-containing protein [Clostridia bacterium]
RGTGADGRSEDPCFNVVYISQLYNDHGETVSALNAKCYSSAHHYYFGIEEGAESEAFVRYRGSDPDTDWNYNGDITLGKGSAAFFPGFVKKLANFIKSYGSAVTAGSTMPEKRYMLAETFSGRGGVYAPDERQNAYEAYKAASEITQGALYEEYIGLSAIRSEKYAADSAEVFTVNGVVAAVSAEGKYGLYSRSGEQLAPFVYDNAEKFETYTDMILLYRDGKKFLYKTGFYFDGETNVRYGILFSENNGFDDVIMLKDGLFILERNGVRFPATYLSAHPDIDCAEYRLIGNDLFYARRGNGKCGLYQVMISGLSEVYPAVADGIEFYDSRKGGGKVAADLLFIREMGACALFIYRDGAALEMTDFIYDGFEVDEETGDVIGISGGGRTVVYKGLNENEYSVVKAVQTLRIVRYNRDLGYGVVDTAGNFVIPAEYGMITSVTSDRFFCSKIKGEDGVIIDGKGKTVASGFRFVYSLSAPDKKNTLYIVEIEGGDVALIDGNGNIKKFDFAVRSVEYGLNDFYYINDAVGYDAKRDVIIEDLTGKR